MALNAQQVISRMDLLQYGVKGMRWGVSRRSKSSSTTSSPSHPPSEDHVKAVLAKSKPASALSNKELNDLITRMELEQRYVKATSTAPPSSPPSRQAKAAKFVGDLLLDIGKQEISKVGRAEANIRLRQVLEKKGRADLAKAIAPKKK